MSFGHQPFRFQPLGDPGDYVTYSISAGRDTGVVAACKDVGCHAWLYGWETFADESDLAPLGGKARADYIRQESGRTFTEHRTAEGMTVFRFEAHQRCFAEHRTNPDVFRVRDGDWRGNPTQRIRLHANGRDWLDDLIEHEGGLADLRQKG